MSEQRLGDSNPRRITADYSMIAADTVVVGTPASGSITVTLPSVAEAPGVSFTFRVNGIVAPYSMVIVDKGDSTNGISEALEYNGATITLESNGQDWVRVR